MHLHRKQQTPPPARWREACVDGVLHVAYAAAVGAESAAHRCARGIARHRTTPRQQWRRRLRAR